MSLTPTTEVTFPDIGHVELRQAADAHTSLAPTEVALAPAYVGICGSDLHVLHGKHPWIRPPVVTGHEVSATVTAVGSDVARVEPGGQVLINPLLHCGRCRHCRCGAFNACNEAQVLGFRAPGAARTRFRVDEIFLHPVPADVSLATAVLAEPLATAWHAVSRCDDLEDVLIIGGGSIGLSVLLALQARGAQRTVLIEPSAAKRQLARELGVTETHPPGAAPAAPGGHSTAIDCVATQETLDLAAASVDNAGVLLVVGVPDQPRHLPLPRLQRFEIDLRGSGLYLPADMDAALALLGSGQVDLTPLVSSSHTMAQAAAAYEAASHLDNVKVLLEIQ